MYRLTNRITVGSYQFNFVNEIEIDSSWQNLTDTCTIKIPKKLTADKMPVVDGAKSVFKIGDKVKVECGYEYSYDTVFEGYLADIKLTFPLELICEDPMWKYKQVSYKKTFEKVSLKELVTFITSKLTDKPVIRYSQSDMQLGKFRISNATGAQVFEELRKTYGIYSFFREGVLYVGFAYTHNETGYRNTVPLDFSKQIVQDNLLYRNKTNIKIKVSAVSIGSDNKRLPPIEVGDPDGITYNFFRPNCPPATLKTLATQFLSTIKVDGFEGDIVTFGKPYVRQGDAVQLIDRDIKERNGVYLVKKVKRTFGQSGYRQTIEIDTKTS